MRNIYHISSRLQFNGELYLLATDQGYINQPDLVWEKLNEVTLSTHNLFSSLLLSFSLLLFSLLVILFSNYNSYAFQVNGDTLFMTGSFKEFKVENHSNETWDENNAMTSTAVCIFCTWIFVYLSTSASMTLF